MSNIIFNSNGYNKNPSGFFTDRLSALNETVHEYDHLINEILIDFLRLIDSIHPCLGDIVQILPNHLRLNNPQEPLSSVLCHCHHQIYGMYSRQGSLAVYKNAIQYILNSASLTQEQTKLQENIAFADNVVEKISRLKENYILFRDHLKLQQNLQQNKPMSTNALKIVLRMFLQAPCEDLLLALAQTSDHFDSKKCKIEAETIRGFSHRIFGFGDRIQNQLKLAYSLFERQNSFGHKTNKRAIIG